MRLSLQIYKKESVPINSKENRSFKKEKRE
jgi:hypothetical protein